MKRNLVFFISFILIASNSIAQISINKLIIPGKKLLPIFSQYNEIWGIVTLDTKTSQATTEILGILYPNSATTTDTIKNNITDSFKQKKAPNVNTFEENVVLKCYGIGKGMGVPFSIDINITYYFYPNVVLNKTYNKYFLYYYIKKKDDPNAPSEQKVMNPIPPDNETIKMN